MQVIGVPEGAPVPIYVVQVGAFQDKSLAERIRGEMETRYGKAQLLERRENPGVWRVLGRPRIVAGRCQRTARPAIRKETGEKKAVRRSTRCPVRTVTHHPLLGDSPEIHSLRRLIEKASRTRLPVLLLGESGTGKEVAARAIHDANPRGTVRSHRLWIAGRHPHGKRTFWPHQGIIQRRGGE